MRHERNELVKMTDRLRRRGYACNLRRFGYGHYTRAIFLSDTQRITAAGTGRWVIAEAELVRIRGGMMYGRRGYESVLQWEFSGYVTTDELLEMFS